jgi:hypothetical protein
MIYQPVPVRLTAFPLPWWKTIFESKQPKPSLLQCDALGIVITRGEEPQDESVLRGNKELKIGWDRISWFSFNRWAEKEIRVDLNGDIDGIRQFYIIWFLGYYWLNNTEALFELMQEQQRKYRGE